MDSAHDPATLSGRIRALGAELEALQRDKDRLDVELAALEGSLEARVRAYRSSGRDRLPLFIAATFLLPLVIVLLVARFSGGGDADSETLYGQVDGLEGAAPVAQGAPCTLFLSPIGGRNEDREARLEVICAGLTLYGGPTSGNADCDEESGRRHTCWDMLDSSDDGDPRMRLERRRGRLGVADAGWRIAIALAVPGADG